MFNNWLFNFNGMDLILPILRSVGDEDSGEFSDKLTDGCQIKVYSNTWDLLAYDEANEKSDTQVLGIALEYGENKDNSLYLDASMSDIEEFAYALIKKIEIIRRDYNKQLQKQFDLGNSKI